MNKDYQLAKLCLETHKAITEFATGSILAIDESVYQEQAKAMIVFFGNHTNNKEMQEGQYFASSALRRIFRHFVEKGIINDCYFDCYYNDLHHKDTVKDFILSQSSADKQLLISKIGFANYKAVLEQALKQHPKQFDLSSYPSVVRLTLNKMMVDENKKLLLATQPFIKALKAILK